MPYANAVNNEFLNNVTVSTSTAGDTSTGTVQNSDNTNAASHAKVAVTTGGASAGDAFVHFYNGVENWSIGIDNDDSDALVISQAATLGTTNVARCTTGGIWNYPLQPGFNAHKNADAANVTGQSEYSPVFNIEKFDQSSNYNSGTGVFTAPVTGKYLFSSVWYGFDCSVADNFVLYIRTSNQLYAIISKRPGTSASASVGGSVLADLDSGDTCYIGSIATWEASNRVDFAGTDIYRNHFSGVLLQ